MYASVRRGHGKAGSEKEVGRILEEEFAPTLAGLPGFVAYYVVNAGNGELITISIFDDEAGVQESARRARELVASRLEGLMDSSLDVSIGEVVVHRGL